MDRIIECKIEETRIVNVSGLLAFLGHHVRAAQNAGQASTQVDVEALRRCKMVIEELLNRLDRKEAKPDSKGHLDDVIKDFLRSSYT